MITTLDRTAILKALESVKDPEIPVLSIIDLGIVTKVEQENDCLVIAITPTFAGCPAIDVMKNDIKTTLQAEGFEHVRVDTDMTVQWNSNKLTAEAKEKLENFGLGIPNKHDGEITIAMVEDATCPYCKKNNTSLNSPFGSALCRSIHYCHNCSSTFERFKPI